ncbi:5-formyltetrahydrofolate cyclo-ligase [Maribacter sp. 2304DJ31-5]|uniref:5-formyltetrahydrofolate cyclo-ligase n=1 Tax=Maribacter sp. 2304DJ31-5 TaxID=3386273 RepID=UPI0039BD73F9
MLKKDLRKKYITKRNFISPSLLVTHSLSIANNLLKLPIWDFTNYHLFLSIIEKKEIDTAYILSILQGKDKNVIVPKIVENHLEHYLLTDATKLKNNGWGVPEPVDGICIETSKIDVVFVPLLAFDKKGHRIGYGKGFYDGFLKECKAEVIKVGLSFFEAEEKITGIFSNDVPMNYCVTPNNTYSFGADSFKSS